MKNISISLFAALMIAALPSTSNASFQDLPAELVLDIARRIPYEDANAYTHICQNTYHMRYAILKIKQDSEYTLAGLDPEKQSSFPTENIKYLGEQALVKNTGDLNLARFIIRDWFIKGLKTPQTEPLKKYTYFFAAALAGHFHAIQHAGIMLMNNDMDTIPITIPPKKILAQIRMLQRMVGKSDIFSCIPHQYLTRAPSLQKLEDRYESLSNEILDKITPLLEEIRNEVHQEKPFRVRIKFDEPNRRLAEEIAQRKLDMITGNLDQIIRESGKLFHDYVDDLKGIMRPIEASRNAGDASRPHEFVEAKLLSQTATMLYKSITVKIIDEVLAGVRNIYANANSMGNEIHVFEAPEIRVLRYGHYERDDADKVLFVKDALTPTVGNTDQLFTGELLKILEQKRAQIAESLPNEADYINPALENVPAYWEMMKTFYDLTGQPEKSKNALVQICRSISDGDYFEELAQRVRSEGKALKVEANYKVVVSNYLIWHRYAICAAMMGQNELLGKLSEAVRKLSGKLFDALRQGQITGEEFKNACSSLKSTLPITAFALQLNCHRAMVKYSEEYDNNEDTDADILCPVYTPAETAVTDAVSLISTFYSQAIIPQRHGNRLVFGALNDHRRDANDFDILRELEDSE